MENVASESDRASVFNQMDQYDWDADEEFKAGFQSILGTQSSPEQLADLTLRAKCFYFSRKTNIPVDFDGYNAWLGQPDSKHESSQSSILLNSSKCQDSAACKTSLRLDAVEKPSDLPAPYPTSFSSIVELISTGHSIPGIKTVPDTVLEGQSSHAVLNARRKPWEKDDLENVNRKETSIDTL